MTAPMDVAADPSKVETLAYNLKELARKPEAATLEGDPAAFGLAPPERTIRLWGAATDAPLATLELGKTSLDRRYVRAGGSEGVEVVDARGLDLLKLPPVRWRDHELFRVPSFEVDAVRIVGPGGELKLRRDRDAWRIVEPIQALARRGQGRRPDRRPRLAPGPRRLPVRRRRRQADADLDRYGLKTPAPDHRGRRRPGRPAAGPAGPPRRQAGRGEGGAGLRPAGRPGRRRRRRRAGS